MDVLRLKGTARQGQKDSGLWPSNPVRRYLLASICYAVLHNHTEAQCSIITLCLIDHAVLHRPCCAP